MDKKNIKSAICRKCGLKNEWIEYMIKIANDNDNINQTEKEMDYYKKYKNGELDRQPNNQNRYTNNNYG
jgi:hypothetical protein